MIGAALGDAGGDGSHPDLGNQLHRNARLRVDAFEVADQLRQILDRIDVVMRRRRDQTDARRRVAHPRDVLVDLVAGKLTTFAGLGALRHLDLQIVGVDEIFRRHAKPTRRHLLDARTHRVAVWQRYIAIGFFTTLAGVGTTTDAVHGNGERGVRLARDRAEAHRAGGEALDDLG